MSYIYVDIYIYIIYLFIKLDYVNTIYTTYITYITNTFRKAIQDLPNQMFNQTSGICQVDFQVGICQNGYPGGDVTRRASIILGGIGISVYLTKTFENMKLQSQKLCYFKTSHTRNSNRIPHSHHRIHQEVLQIWWSKKNLQAARTFSKHPNNHTESPFIKWIKMSASRPQHEGLSGRNSHLYEPIFNSWHPSWHRDQMQCSKFFYDCNGWLTIPRSFLEKNPVLMIQ